MYESKKKNYYGTGSIIFNGREIDNYFGLDTLKLIVNQPLVTTDLQGKVDVVVTVAGGGVSGQAGAIRHGNSRALVTLNPEYRASLKAAGFMTRDPRMKERKKYGLKAARRAPQFSKRLSLILQSIQKPRNHHGFRGFLYALFYALVQTWCKFFESYYCRLQPK